MKMEFEKIKETNTWLLEVNDLVGVVAWHLMKRDVCVNKHKDPLEKKVVNGKVYQHGLHQLLKPSQNQYRYQGHVRNDSKHFYSNDLKLVKLLVKNHMKNIMRQRIKTYTETLSKWE